MAEFDDLGLGSMTHHNCTVTEDKVFSTLKLLFLRNVVVSVKLVTHRY